MGTSYAPNFSIEIGGKKFSHGTTIDVLSVSVTETADRADSFTISLRDRHEEYARFPAGAKLKWMDDDAFQEGKSVVIEMGYGKDMRQVMLGEITAISPSFPENGMPTLSVRGFNYYHWLQRKRRRESFETTTDSGIAEELAKDLKLQVKVDATTVEYPLITPKGDTYHGILGKRAKRIGYEVVVNEKTLFFQEPRYIKEPSSIMALEWGRDLRSFAPKAKTYGLITKVNVRASQTAEGGGKKAIVGEALAGDERVKLGEQAGSQIAEEIFGENSVQVEERDIVSQEEANIIARARLENKSMEYITGRGACIGNSKLKPRTVIELKGLGQRFSGNYYVTSVTHTIDASGYRCDFEVKRNAR